MFDESFKQIEYYNDYVIIKHYILNEYNNSDFCEDYTYEMFKERTLLSYKLGEELGWTSILDVSTNTIISKMPIYKILIHNKSLFDINRLLCLVKEMNTLRVYHNDLAFRNIGIDHDTDAYKLIDLSSLTKDVYWKVDVSENNIIEYGNNSYLEDDVKTYKYT